MAIPTFRVVVFIQGKDQPLKYRGVNGSNEFQKFVKFLNVKHPDWKYFNVYNQKKEYVNRIYKKQ